jgi:hypothetical protein
MFDSSVGYQYDGTQEKGTSQIFDAHDSGCDSQEAELSLFQRLNEWRKEFIETELWQKIKFTLLSSLSIGIIIAIPFAVKEILNFALSMFSGGVIGALAGAGISCALGYLAFRALPGLIASFLFKQECGYLEIPVKNHEEVNRVQEFAASLAADALGCKYDFVDKTPQIYSTLGNDEF